MKTRPDIAIPSEGLKSPGQELMVEVRGLKISFGRHMVLNGIDLSLRKGENLVVMGKSGSGKSVLIKCLVRLLEPDGGVMKMFGKDVETMGVRELNETRKRIGFLFQSAALYDSMTVRENLEFPLRDAKGIKPSEIKTRVEEVLENVGLTTALHKMPVELSGGMRKRIGLARTLILKPEIIFYDEPTTGLDPVTAREISELIVEVQRKYETSCMIITHDLECARITANRIVMLKNGQCTAEGTFQEMERSGDPWIRSFFE